MENNLVCTLPCSDRIDRDVGDVREAAETVDGAGRDGRILGSASVDHDIPQSGSRSGERHDQAHPQCTPVWRAEMLLGHN